MPERMTDAEFEALKADTVARAERGNRGELTPAERVQTRDDIGRVLDEARRRIIEWKASLATPGPTRDDDDA